MADAARRAAAKPEARRVIRGAMLTPWSAVSVGIVLAASLALASPRAVLTFPPSKAAHCQASGCGPGGTGNGGTPLPAAKQGVKFPRISTGTPNSGSGGLAARRARLAELGPVRVQYALLPENGAHFTALIVITAQRPLGSWTLRFLLPGARIKLVMWARWTPVGRSGGMISGSPWPSGPSGASRARVVIMGIGAPSRPSGCVFDGARCSFRDFSGGVTHFNWAPSQDGGN